MTIKIPTNDGKLKWLREITVHFGGRGILLYTVSDEERDSLDIQEVQVAGVARG